MLLYLGPGVALLVGLSRDRFPVVSLGIFSLVPPKEPCALRSTQPLKVSTRDYSWGKGDRCLWLTTYHPCSSETSRKSGALTEPEPLGPPRPVAGHLYFTLLYYYTYYAFKYSEGEFEKSDFLTQMIQYYIRVSESLTDTFKSQEGCAFALSNYKVVQI